MENEVTIREIEESDTERVFSLHNELLHDSRSPTDWRWEYRTYHPESSVFLLAETDGRIIGTQGMIPIPLNIRGKRVLTAKGENVLVDRSYRGRTLFQQLFGRAVTMCGAKGMCCVWGLTKSEIVVKQLRDKFHFAVFENAIQTYALVLKGGVLPEQIRARMDTRFAPMLVWSCYLYSLFCRSTFSSSGVREGSDVAIERALRSEDDLRLLYERLRLANNGLIHIDQDSSFLAWRIVNNPRIQYATYFLYEREILKAYCYVNTNDEIDHMTDFTCEDGVNGKILLRRVIHDLEKSHAKLVLFIGNSANHVTSLNLRLLKRFGFLRVSMLQTSFVVKNISCKADISDLRDWYVNGLWTEGYEW